MLRSKLETRLRGLIAFSVLSVMGALVSGISAQRPADICTLPKPGVPTVMVLSVREGPVARHGRRMTVVHVGSAYALPVPPAVPLPPQPPAIPVL